MSYKAKKYGHLDKTHLDISNALKDCGWSVGETSGAAGFVDLVCASSSHTVLFEAKVLTGNYDLAQLEFASLWAGYICFVYDAETAILAMRKPDKYCLSLKEKNLLNRYVERKKATSKAKKILISVATFQSEFMTVVRPERVK